MPLSPIDDPYLVDSRKIFHEKGIAGLEGDGSMGTVTEDTRKSLTAAKQHVCTYVQSTPSDMQALVRKYLFIFVWLSGRRVWYSLWRCNYDVEGVRMWEGGSRGVR